MGLRLNQVFTENLCLFHYVMIDHLSLKIGVESLRVFIVCQIAQNPAY
ncbi:hypothetical protein SAMD00079811_64190 [Scytonema sp. HK-05]|nr:hypothetical protein SAMD00079811_64190 [Scytonema sp. HK-05]